MMTKMMKGVKVMKIKAVFKMEMKMLMTVTLQTCYTQQRMEQHIIEEIYHEKLGVLDITRELLPRTTLAFYSIAK